MAELLPKTPPINEFPNDDKLRVIWSFGASFQNNSNAVDLPLVEVSLKEILPNGELSEEPIVKVITLAQIDIARQWTVWLGNKRTTEYWTNVQGYEHSKDFYFNFKEHEPLSIKRLDKKPNSNHYYIPPYMHPLGNMPTKASFVHFMNSTYTKLIASDDTTVLIPAVEFLTSTYTPDEQQIRNQLVMNPIDNVVDRNIEEYYEEDSVYHVHLKTGKRDTNISFLSYLALNPVTRERLSKLWASLNVVNKDQNGRSYSDRYPVVLPYHPENLRLNTSGYWIDNTIFLCLRINIYSLPTDFASRCHYRKSDEDEEEREPQGNGSSGSGSLGDDEDPYDKPLVGNENPHTGGGYIDIRTEVKYFDDELLDIEKVEESEKNPRYIPPEQNGKETQDIEQFSSGEDNRKEESNGTAGVRLQKLKKSKKTIDQAELLNDVSQVLEELVVDVKSSLAKVEYINEALELCTDRILSCFPVTYKDIKEQGTWASGIVIKGEEKTELSKHVPRSILLMRLTLLDGRSTYLLEIDRKLSKEAYRGLLFNTDSSVLEENELELLLRKIMEYKGRYTQAAKSSSKSKRTRLGLPIPYHEIYDHKLISNSLRKKMNKVIEKYSDEKYNLFKV